ncbi:aromatic amino acid ammonia-lyase [Streptomyces sp. SPB074]|uniref:aromatic amino acid ammonia-lyase n=1 Tax=Streptomyces sp. (strain SPB074) TaxID=465543 RepID=UPI00017F29CE|nr:aromatic amino acid ammonia-lyase [Streptomyces sp. SPB074]EDY46727.2 phenylalanine and histidine ammonia-lyase [Streptomyces sp. SPB074]
MAENPASVSLLGGAFAPAATASAPFPGEDAVPVPGNGPGGPGHGFAPRAADVVRIVDGARPAPLTPAELAPARRAWHAARELAASGRVYGRSTGVGANRTAEVRDADHGLRLLRSHAGAIGPRVAAREARALLTVRAQQLLAGGAGLDPRVVVALTEALRGEATPVLHSLGGVGTGDLGPLAQLGLALTGEGAWEGGTPPGPLVLDSNDALALISSNALAVGRACLALEESRTLLRAANGIAALSLLAVDGSAEPFAAPVAAARPYRGQRLAARRMRDWLGLPARPAPPAGRIQDPFAFRCLPQTLGPAYDAADTLDAVLAVELSAAAENPLISAGDGAAYHHGNFYAGQLGLALDAFRLALLPVARSSAARLAALCEPALTGLRPFLGDTATASSGVMILEYAAASAVAETQALAQPASLGHVVLSRGVEEQAGFASLSAAQSLRMPQLLRNVLGCELVAAVRALRMSEREPAPGTPAARALAVALDTLPADFGDRPLTADVALAEGLVEQFAEW